MASTYSNFKTIINDFLDEESDQTAQEIADDLYEAYLNDEISGREYDSLSSRISDYL